MTPELIATLAVGVALAGLMLRGHHGLGARMDRLETRVDDLAADVRTVSADVRTVSERLARVEGAVCGPWTGRPDTADAPPS